MTGTRHKTQNFKYAFTEVVPQNKKIGLQIQTITDRAFSGNNGNCAKREGDEERGEKTKNAKAECVDKAVQIPIIG